MVVYGQHMLVLGAPREGKTTFAVSVFKSLPDSTRAVLINTQWEDYADGFGQKVFVPPKIPIEAPKTVWWIQSDTQDLMAWLKELYNKQKMSDPLMQHYIFIDEAHLYFPRYQNVHNTDNVAIKNLFTMGLRWNIIICLISQKPQHLNTDLYTLCTRRVAFHLEEHDVAYLQSLKYNVKGVPQRSYEYEVF